MRRRRRRLNKRAVALAVASVAVLISIIIQFAFMPKWQNGHQNKYEKSAEGVHTQEGTDLNRLEAAQKIKVTN